VQEADPKATEAKVIVGSEPELERNADASDAAVVDRNAELVKQEPKYLKADPVQDAELIHDAADDQEVNADQM
jgi:hypothetical protein